MGKYVITYIYLRLLISEVIARCKQLVKGAFQLLIKVFWSCSINGIQVFQVKLIDLDILENPMFKVKAVLVTASNLVVRNNGDGRN